MTPAEFVAKYQPIADQCSARAKGLDPNVILAQFAIETATVAGWGTSPLCVDHLNLAGISHFNGWANSGGFCSFPTLDDFVVAWGQVINNGLYDGVLNSVNESADAQATALGASPWAASHYNDGNGPGSSLIAIMGELTNSAPAPTPAPSPASDSTTTIDGRRAYIVQSGDNLSVIASRFNLTLQEVEAWNPQFAPDYSLIHPGNTVYLEAAVPAPTPAPAPTPDYAQLKGDLQGVAQSLLSISSGLSNAADSLTATASKVNWIADQL